MYTFLFKLQVANASNVYSFISAIELDDMKVISRIENKLRQQQRSLKITFWCDLKYRALDIEYSEVSFF